MKIRKIVVVLGIICLASIMLGCSKKPATPAPEAGAKAERGLTVGVLVEPQVMSTLYTRDSNNTDQPVLYQMYDTPLYIDSATGEIKPWLATSWEFTPDMLQLTMKFRDDVYFHNGYKMTAEDVKFTIDTAEAMYPNRFGNLDYVELLDEYTIKVHFTAPYAPILNWLCCRYYCILSKKYWDEVGQQGYEDKPIGTGPFQFVSRTPGDRIVMDRYDNYWKGPAQFNRVTIRPVPDVNTLLLALQTGEVDVVLYAPIENMLRLNDPNIEWNSGNSTASMFLKFSFLETSFVQNDLNFRKAVQYAADKEAMNQAVFGGRATLIDIVGFDKFSTRPIAGTYSTYTHDVEKAKEFLAASNYRGQEFRLVTRAGSTEARVTEVLQGSLQEIGINARVVPVDNATYLDISNISGDFDARMEAATASIIDADRWFLDFARERITFGQRWQGMGVNELDSLVHRAREEPDYDKRLALWTEAATVNNDAVNIIYFMVDADTIAFRKDLKDVKLHFARYIRMWEWGY